MNANANLQAQINKLQRIFLTAMREGNFSAARQAVEAQNKLMGYDKPAINHTKKTAALPVLSDAEMEAYHKVLETEC